MLHTCNDVSCYGTLEIVGDIIIIIIIIIVVKLQQVEDSWPAHRVET